MLIDSMSIQQALQNEIEESRRWIEVEKPESTYRRDLRKRIELINWVLEGMKKPDIFICEVIKTRMNQIIDKINEKDSILEADPLLSELRTIDWIFYQVCRSEIKQIERI
jgi:hypothetical protein